MLFQEWKETFLWGQHFFHLPDPDKQCVSCGKCCFAFTVNSGHIFNSYVFLAYVFQRVHGQWPFATVCGANVMTSFIGIFSCWNGTLDRLLTSCFCLRAVDGTLRSGRRKCTSLGTVRECSVILLFILSHLLM